MASAVLRDDETLQRTTQLIDFLATVTDTANRNPLRDICAGTTAAPDPLLWIEDFPDGVSVSLDAEGDVLFALRPVPLVPPPALPADLVNHVDGETINDADREPRLQRIAPELPEVESAVPEPSVAQAFDRWLDGWRMWAEEERPRRRRRWLYDQMESAAKVMEQRDDEVEFVVATGLVCWRAPDGQAVRRHLLTEPVRPSIDKRTAEVRVTRVGGHRRMEDRELFEGQQTYVPDRGRGHRISILESDLPLDAMTVMDALREWLGLSITVPVICTEARTPPGAALPSAPELSPSPAFLLRPRSQVLVAEAYRRIAEELRRPDAAVPVGLAQLIVDTEPAERDAWLASQGATTGDLLGEDPLFPLSANGEQRRVVELLRTETGVVVQGPPGTGKTHTIANIVSALLARGQRVVVTSQKDQALKVLREKIPGELRHLCVLLAGGSRGAAAELQRGLDAFSAAHASADRRQLQAEVRMLSEERDNLRARATDVNEQIARLREIENFVHQPVVPGFSTDLYRGTLTQIVRDVQSAAAVHSWMPDIPASAPDAPPLDHATLLELLELLRLPKSVLAARAGQDIPPHDHLPPAGVLADLLAEERRANDIVNRDSSRLSRRLSTIGLPALDQLDTLGGHVRRAMVACGLSETGATVRTQDWVARAVADRLAGRHSGLWGHLLQVRDEAQRLQDRLQMQGVRFVVEIPPITGANLGTAKGWLNCGAALLDHVRAGGKIRNRIQRKVQRDAEPLMEVVLVDGRPPGSADQLAAALERIDAEVAVVQLAQKWADAGVPLVSGHLAAILSELADNAALLAEVDEFGGVHRAMTEHLDRCGVPVDVSTTAALVQVLDAIPAARQQHVHQHAEQRITSFRQQIRHLAARPGACAELAEVLRAAVARDSQAYADGVESVELARNEQRAYRRAQELSKILDAVHPELSGVLRQTPHDEVWAERLGRIAESWAWSKAHQFVQHHRNAELERQLAVEFEQLDDHLDIVITRLVAARAMLALLDRMSDAHSRALNTYREHMGKIGAGTGTKTQEFRKAARAAMRKAQDAVPAWVVPLPSLLENLEPRRDSFDVVIVDEASQVGIEHLYLLWLAPRVIVVGDDKQCTPGPGRLGDLDWLFARNAEFMPDVDRDVRLNFTQKSNLYGVLSARSGRDAVVRLREHFRCMPEIINWSSMNFYPDNSGKPGLVPLRERRADDLEPLKVVPVHGAETEGSETRRRNPREAKVIVETLIECLADRRYDGKSFGVVVLQGTGQVKLLDHEINAAISTEDRQERQIRVGIPSDFQGDERDVIFLSMVVAARPNAVMAENYRQSYNVAASRAKDQMWLFTSVDLDQLKPGDLRASLLGYMLNPPSIYGESPGLDQVSANRRCEPFDSLFEQRVFREIKKRGYHVVPQHPVGSRSLDLVVAGAGGRIAVECDGHHWHTGVDDQVNDARRDRELARMGWQTIRLRESEFEFDRDRELRPLWEHLAARGIMPYNNDAAPSTRDGASGT